MTDSDPDFEQEPLQDGQFNKLARAKDSSRAPEDKNNMIYLIFHLYGVGILLPWNAVLTAFDFFEAKVSDSSYCVY